MVGRKPLSDRETHWELMLAEDGEQAVRMLFAEELDSEPLPDLILLDLEPAEIEWK